jgi:hypothetical protein
MAAIRTAREWLQLYLPIGGDFRKFCGLECSPLLGIYYFIQLPVNKSQMLFIISYSDRLRDTGIPAPHR